MNYWADKSSFSGKLIRPFFFAPFPNLVRDFFGTHREFAGTSKGLSRDLTREISLSGPCEVPVRSLLCPCQVPVRSEFTLSKSQSCLDQSPACQDPHLTRLFYHSYNLKSCRSGKLRLKPIENHMFLVKLISIL
jgi:hypothetical protein